MAEYLPPGVYVEEIDTGSEADRGRQHLDRRLVGLPSAGRSTCRSWSPAPATTSAGSAAVAATATSSIRRCRPGPLLLPHAVEGFFTNGGRRLYVVRVAPAEAARGRARALYFAASGVAMPATLLLLRGRRGRGRGPGRSTSSTPPRHPRRHHPHRRRQPRGIPRRQRRSGDERRRPAAERSAGAAATKRPIRSASMRGQAAGARPRPPLTRSRRQSPRAPVEPVVETPRRPDHASLVPPCRSSSAAPGPSIWRSYAWRRERSARPTSIR